MAPPAADSSVRPDAPPPAPPGAPSAALPPERAAARPAALRLICFDLDGTLVDSWRDIALAINHVLAQEGLAEIPLPDMARHIGRPLAEIFRSLLPEAGPDRIEEASRRYRDRYFDHGSRHTRPYPGVPDLLSALKDEGKILAVATTKKTYMALHLLDNLGLSSFFDLILGTDEIPAKPDPTICRICLDRFRISPAHALMVGDTEGDLLAGRRAGMMTGAALYGYGRPDLLRALNPDVLLDRPLNLLEWMRS